MRVQPGLGEAVESTNLPDIMVTGKEVHGERLVGSENAPESPDIGLVPGE